MRIALAAIAGSLVFLILSPDVMSVATSGPEQRFQVGDGVIYADRTFTVTEVRDWYASPMYLLTDEDGNQTLEGTERIDRDGRPVMTSDRRR